MNPWWEVDLGSEVPIQSIVIFNRTDGRLGSRLNGYTLKVLANNHKTIVFSETKNKAPAVSATHKIGGEEPLHVVRRAAMNAMPSVRGQELKTFQTLAKFVGDNTARADAIHALQRVPRSSGRRNRRRHWWINCSAPSARFPFRTVPRMSPWKRWSSPTP